MSRTTIILRLGLSTFFLVANLLGLASCLTESATADGAIDVRGEVSNATTATQPVQQPGGRRRSAQALKLRLTPNWFGDNTKFWYRNDLARGQKEFLLVDAAKGTRSLAFNHDKMAAALSTVLEDDVTGSRLPFDEIVFTQDEKSIRIRAEGGIWECNLKTYECSRIGDVPRESSSDRESARETRQLGSNGQSAGAEDRLARLESTWPDGLQGEFLETTPAFSAPGLEDAPLSTGNESPKTSVIAQPRRGLSQSRRSPDGKWTAFVRDHNVYIRRLRSYQSDDGEEQAEKGPEEIQLSYDGESGQVYRFFSWSPDSKTLVSFRTESGENHEVHFVESSPDGGGRAVLHSRSYALPGDKFTAYELNLFDIRTSKHIKPDVDRVDFRFPRVRWSEDGSSFTYQKVDRGHQRFRVIRVDARTGEARNIIDEKTETFIWTAHGGWPYVNYLDDSNEILYASEQDGWRHLYLYDATTGELKKQITKGEWVVRGIDEVDEERRQIWFRASGMYAEQDPYLIHYCRINFDGTGLVELTAGNGTHSVSYSPDKKYFVDSYSRVDAAPKHELRRTSDGGLILELESADISALEESGWRTPEVFSAKGRDGETDIWGLIHRPRDFDPEKDYPIIEYIYAGPHDSHVPKSFSPGNRFANLTRLGFIVVQIDGMGTANRSKAFHDVCWHNLKDAGFPDRIAWIKAAAEKYPYMDAERVGIYGTSAGGQNSTGALLFHPDFYKAAVSACGCHDNRMDKASWNEQWMGYPVGPHYSESSNIDHAGNLVGHLLLIVGEMDTNVPPESTFRLVDALIKANKDFDLLVVPGGGHTSGGRYGTRRLEDFFVKHLQGIDPPNRNAVQPSEQGDRGTQPVAFVIETCDIQTQAVKQDGQTQGNDQDDAAQEAEFESLDLTPFLAPASEMRAVSERFEADRGNLERFYSIKMSPQRRHRMERFYGEWLAALAQLETCELSEQAQDDFVALEGRIRDELQSLANEAAQDASVRPLVNFAPSIVHLAEARQRKEDVNSRAAAGLLNRLTQHVRQMRVYVEQRSEPKSKDDVNAAPNELGEQAADAVLQLRQTLAFWHDFHNAYDPLFTWWMREPYSGLTAELKRYADALRSASVQSDTFDAANLPVFAEAVPPQHELLAGLQPSVPNLRAIISQPQSEMQGVIEEYRSSNRRGRGPSRGFGRGQDADQSERESRLRRWINGLQELDFEKLSRDGQVDYLMFANSLRNDLRAIEDSKQIQDTVKKLAPFSGAVDELVRQRSGRRFGRDPGQRGQSRQEQQAEIADDDTAGKIFEHLAESLPQVTKAAHAALAPPAGTAEALDVAATTQVVRAIERMQVALQVWRDNRAKHEIEPASELTASFDTAHQALATYSALWRKHSDVATSDDPDGIVGQPIGRVALERELRAEMIAYSPEELIEIAYAELETCHDELRKASRELGYGDDWHRAVEHVKAMHVPPGEQPGMIRDLAWEAIDYMRDNDLLTVPAVAAETWRMEMMSPQRQLVSPFFLGGESIIVSYPTDGMAHDDKLQSMRGNNIPFARATVQHELIPGHHLQGFMSRRYHRYRNMFNTPFFIEGWALYWELVLYERGFPRTPEERIGMLVWRSHRCARIIFSLSYHMGLMNPQECIDFLVENVGFERNNSTAEVRRSFGGGYGPLYQAAYLLGGIQLRELRKELVESGKMPEKEFHDTILKNSCMPIDMVRASLTDIPLSPDYETSWRFHPLKP